jgi:hypothetical protein
VSAANHRQPKLRLALEGHLLGHGIRLGGPDFVRPAQRDLIEGQRGRLDGD